MVLKCERKHLDLDKIDKLRERIHKLRDDIYVLIHIQDPDYLVRMGKRKESYWRRLFKLEEIGIDKLKKKLAEMELKEEQLVQEWDKAFEAGKYV
tara:strand:+ start:273 stop:557 length:285 start_codon:yes stop_codon:yes gene_type:complete